MLYCLLTAVVLLAADDTAGVSAEQIAALVRQLDAAEAAQRNEAEGKLLELGPEILPRLPVVDDRTSAEVVQRLTRVQQSLYERQAKAAALPTLVTLDGTDLPLADAFAAIAKQTGNPIVDYRDAFGEEQTARRVTVHFDKMPFWQAMDELLDQSNMTLYGFAGQRGAFLVDRGGDSGPRVGRAHYSSVFRLEPLRFEAVRDLRSENAQSLRLFLEATWEPRLQPIAILQPLSQVTATSDTGEVIGLAGGESEPEAAIREGMAAAELEIAFELPSRKAQKISTLKGKLTALVPGAVEDFRFKGLAVSTRNAPAKKVEQRKAGATVTIDQVRKNNDAWEVSLRVKYNSPSIALESHRGWVLDNEVFFIDADGKRIDAGGYEQTRQTRDEVGVSYYFLFDGSPEKLEFVYRTPLTILEIPLEYEFKDLHLP